MLRPILSLQVLLALLLSLVAQADPITVHSLGELVPYLDDDGVAVKLAAGVYTVTAKEAKAGEYTNPLFVFSGDDSSYDFSGVTLEVETGVMQAFGRADVTQVHVRGERNVLKNLTLVDVGDTSDAPTWRATNVVIDGAHNRIEGFHMTISGSFPYGYGDLFGKGAGPVIRHKKHCGVLIRGDFNHVKGCTLIHRAYGHGIYAQGAYDCLVEDCHVEGELRTTDDVLTEQGSGSPADEVDFITVWGYPVPPGYMISLQEDGIRSYGKARILDGTTRETVNMTVKNCTVDKMRSGVVLAHNKGERIIADCTTTNCETGYSIGRGRIINCRSDAKYGPVYRAAYATDNQVTADITILSNEGAYNGSGLIAYIAGRKGIHINLKPEGAPAAAEHLKILVGGDSATLRHLHQSNPSQDKLKALGLVVQNSTTYPIILDALSSECPVESAGEITDHGSNNRIHSNRLN